MDSRSFGILGVNKSPSSIRNFGLLSESVPFYSWDIMKIALCRVVAIDLRGFNLSDKPLGKHNYKAEHVVDDLRALIHHLSM